MKKNHYRGSFEQMHQFDNASKSDVFNDDASSDDFELDANPRNHSRNNEHRKWHLSTNIDSIDVAMCMTKYQTRIQIDKVPLNMLKSMQFFYVCEHCGKVYWDGSRLERTFNGVLKDFIVE